MNYIQIQVDDALREMNEGAITDDERLNHYHNTIYTTIFGDPPTEPNLFSTSGLNYFFCRHQDFNFYNNLLVYLTKYLTEFTQDKQLRYIKYVCECVYGATSQWARGDQRVNIENLNSFGEAAIRVLLSLVEAGVLSEEDKNILSNCVKPIETTSLSRYKFYGGKSKNRKSKNHKTKKRKTKKRKTKKRKSKRPKSTRKRV